MPYHMAGAGETVCNETRELYISKAAEICENIIEEMRLAEEGDNPEDSGTHAIKLHGMLAMFKDSCRDNGVPRLKRRQHIVRRMRVDA